MSLRRSLTASGTGALLAAGLVLGTLVGTAGVASATTVSVASAPVTAGDGDGDGGFHKLCEKVTDRLARVEKAQARFAADASTRGSNAFLEARIAKATAAGQPDFAHVLSNRLASRKLLATIAPQRLTLLKDSAATCAKHLAAEGQATPSS